jgi:hypothetical protein
VDCVDKVQIFIGTHSYHWVLNGSQQKRFNGYSHKYHEFRQKVVSANYYYQTYISNSVLEGLRFDSRNSTDYHYTRIKQIHQISLSLEQRRQKNLMSWDKDLLSGII